MDLGRSGNCQKSSGRATPACDAFHGVCPISARGVVSMTITMGRTECVEDGSARTGRNVLSAKAERYWLVRTSEEMYRFTFHQPATRWAGWPASLGIESVVTWHDEHSDVEEGPCAPMAPFSTPREPAPGER
jgi:hypothetical protein